MKHPFAIPVFIFICLQVYLTFQVVDLLGELVAVERIAASKPKQIKFPPFSVHAVATAVESRPDHTI